ncbi:hypothetical protein ACFSC6_14095 [Rufibacter sediminis]|uniref:Tetratricopeptide repeat protein n=1 Tax=Rufibacter sediminis TaxID=2762756 RepID=A0ABR6VZ01_9BACT|nr:hypothetical protein [Rufibacter sediminis]MBC3542323.1 hypothetical protein [Rufibacter sediminis]
MEELIKLIQIIEKRGGLPAHTLNNNSKEKKLYSEIIKGRITDEATAILVLYTDAKEKSGLKMVKSRLRKKLMNQLFFIDENNEQVQSSHIVEQTCLSKFLQARILLDAGANDLALPLLKQSLSKSKEYDFNYISSLCLRAIIQAYVNLKERNLFYKAAEQLKSLGAKLTADQESEMIFSEANIELSRSVVSRKDYIQLIDSVLSKMNAIWQQAKTFETFNNYYRLSMWLHELNGNFDEIVTLTEKSQQILKEHSNIAKRFDHRYNHFIQVYAHLRAKKIEEGLVLANTYLHYFNPSSNNWFAYMENYTLLAVHAKKYEVAHTLFHQVQSNPFIKKINKLAQERWTLLGAYLQFIAPQSDSPVKWQNLVHNSPSYSKDKEGFNVAILILQVMYYLEIMDYEALEYRVDSLKKYAQHHFKDSFSERSRIFFKLLAVLVRSNFEYTTTQKKAQYLFNKLQRTPTPGDAYAEIEIIPYEHLWEFVLDRIKKAALYAK